MARVLQMRWIINGDARCPYVTVELNYSPSNPLEREQTYTHTRANIYQISQFENKKGNIGTV